MTIWTSTPLPKTRSSLPRPIILPATESAWNTPAPQQDFTPAATHPVEGVPNLLGMVTAGYGVALLPEVLVRGQMPAGQVRRLRAPGSSLPPEPALAAPIHLPGTARNFLLVARKVADRTSAVSS